ncbi:hypothetical protein GE09DRAFT_1217430 [Coniochaeta sp. 2T2.1]|nr:hypothetical protein GE09DRAFT_1217430 [Coniochaeta sp. 2T2.1]
MEADALYEDEYGTPVIELDRIWERNRFRYRFSAAAAAVHFLRHNPSSRPHMRRLVLNEDRESVTYPESHGKGLIPFCNENPLLRIERRLDFVRDVVVANSGTCPYRDQPWKERLRAHGKDIPDDEAGNKRRAHMLHDAEEVYQGWHDRWPDVEVHTKYLTKCLVNWIREASALPASISLVLDGSSAPEQASHVFRHCVIPLAIWQEALETSYRRGLLPKSEDVNAQRPRWADTGSWPEYSSLRSDTKEFTVAWWFWRAVDESEGEGFVAPGFPERIRDIISGSRQVRCNFYVDPLLQADVEKLITDHCDCSKEGSKEGWYDNKMLRDSFAVIDVWRDPMKPVLRALTRENALPKSEGVESG